MEKTKREQAMAYFREGYNCSQSVLLAYAEDYGIQRNMACRIAASFGGGMGRMREVCGAFSGMLLVAGLETGAVEGKDAAGKKANYDVVQMLARRYRERNGGDSIYCKELLGLVPKKGQTQQGTSVVARQQDLKAAEFTDTTPEARTESYYKKRPCPELIGLACDILDEWLQGDAYGNGD